MGNANGQSANGGSCPIGNQGNDTGLREHEMPLYGTSESATRRELKKEQATFAVRGMGMTSNDTCGRAQRLEALWGKP